MITANWQAPANIATLSTTRANGVSMAPFSSFNLALHVGDKEADVLANRNQLARSLPATPVWLNQVHSADVVVVDKQFDHRQVCSADALYTRIANQPLAIMTADCLAILLCTKDGNEVAAIHGGWRGLAGGIIANTLTNFIAPTKEIIAWFGPAIGAQQFEVGNDVKETFLELAPAYGTAFTVQREDKYLADIYALAKLQLADHGVLDVSGGEYCTVSQPELFFSYRRDGQTGRMASLIWRK
ncbi:peptidoglycan editing factor PgeF [Pseudoalteromonas mariniglutinosa]|uniref:peptidoglycan editing factor PgeF n=1 Tax=Pseudoalteromonas mariniglutinosa TaxID=206042 RepID=UPI00384A99A1